MCTMRASRLDTSCRKCCRHIHRPSAVARAPPTHWAPHLTTHLQWQQQNRPSRNQLEPLQASKHTGSDPSPSPPTPQPPPLISGGQGQPGRDAPPVLPGFMDGINWYCYCSLGLLFLTDLTPLGQWLLSSPGPTSSITGFPLRLAALQWAAFVAPTLFWIKRAGWDLGNTLRLQQPAGGAASRNYYIIGLVAGPALWLAINTAIALRTGNTEQLTAALSGAAPLPSAGLLGLDGATVTPGMLLLGVGADGGSGVGVQQALLLLLFAAVLPAVAEELLFRGFLLTALQQRLGSIDAAAVAAALFALIHLDVQQFFLYCVLGGACGLLAVRSGSVWPAVVLHAAFNATAVATGLMLHR